MRHLDSEALKRLTAFASPVLQASINAVATMLRNCSARVKLPLTVWHYRRTIALRLLSNAPSHLFIAFSQVHLLHSSADRGQLRPLGLKVARLKCENGHRVGGKSARLEQIQLTHSKSNDIYQRIL